MGFEEAHGKANSEGESYIVRLWGNGVRLRTSLPLRGVGHHSSLTFNFTG